MDRCAAECGLAAAQLRLGRMLLEGSEGERDQRAAFGWFGRAADQGDTEAMNMVGRCHENGWGVSVDLERAAELSRLGRPRRTTGASTTRQSAVRWPRRRARPAPRAALVSARRVPGTRTRDEHRRPVSGRRLGMPAQPRGRRLLVSPVGALRLLSRPINHAVLLAERGLVESAADWFWKAAAGGDAQMRRSVAATLAAAAHPTLQQVRARVLELGASPPGGNRRSWLGLASPVAPATRSAACRRAVSAAA